MNFFKLYTYFFEKYFPSPLAIALLLSFFTFFFCLFVIDFDGNFFDKSSKIGSFWFEGIWNENLLAFTMHMMLILVLGHILALTPAVNKVIQFGLLFCKSTASAVFTLTFFTILISFFNWGLGLVFGAVFARKIGEHFAKQNIPTNYPLIGAAAYSGMMVWHGGLSGSATLTLAGTSHSLVEKIGVVSLSNTTFGSLNIFVLSLLILVLPLCLYLLGKRVDNKLVLNFEAKNTENETNSETQWLDSNNFFGILIGLYILSYWIYLNFQNLANGVSILSTINLQTINLLLLGLCFLLHRNLHSFSKALEKAIGGASGILIQFPIYFGIMGMVQHSGLNIMLSNLLSSASSDFLLSVYTFVSAGLLNIFVPSGGGQWQLQGMIIVEAAQKVNADLPKLIMAFCYGDQLTNMLQPFWALPLLGITGLKAREILPFTLIIFTIGLAVFLLGLIIY